MAKLKPYAISFLGGIVYSLAWPTSLCEGFAPAAVPGMAMLLYCFFRENKLGKKLLLALAFCLPYTLIGFYWIPDTLAEFGQLPYLVALMLGAMFTLISAPQLYVAVLLVHFVFQHRHLSPFEFRYRGVISICAALLFAWAEYFTPSQFPVMIGQPWAKFGEHLGWASVGGLPLFGFFSFLAAMEIGNFARFRTFSKINLAAVLVFAATNPLVDFRSKEEGSAALNIRMVQANISNFLKVDSESGGYASVSQVISRYRELSESPSHLGKLDLVVWPETAYPFGVETSKEDLAQTELPPAFVDTAAAHNADAFIGGYDVISTNGDYYQSEYNSTFHISGAGKLEDVYHKHILIPFGETLPLGPLTKHVAKYFDNISFFSEGKSYPLFRIATGHTFINTICYEILKPEFVRTYLNKHEGRPHALINLTNDSWYGDTSEPEQHLFLASWRSLEFDLPIIRSTNTGISVFLDQNGQEVERLGVGETGNLDLRVVLGKRSPTIFQQFGFWILLPVCFALFIFHLLLIRFKR